MAPAPGLPQVLRSADSEQLRFREKISPMSGFLVCIRSTYVMELSEQDILRVLMRSRDRVAAAAWLVVRDTQAAEDVFQNVAIKAMTKEVCFESDGAVLSWAFITARREAVDWLRRHRRESVAPRAQILDLLEGEWMAAGLREDHRAAALRECLDELNGKSRDLLRQRYFNGLSCADVAERVGAKLDAVYKRLSRLHQMLKDCVENRLDEPEAAEA